jgi:hypothetical protein
MAAASVAAARLAAFLLLAGLAVPPAALAHAPPVASAPGPAAAATPDTGSATGLRYRYDALHERIVHNAFDRPLAMSSLQEDERLEGDITARVDHPFAEVAHVLDGVDRWCDVLILHLNTKQCTGQGNVIRMRVGRKWNQPVADAYALAFVYHPEVAAADYLRVGLTATDGPMGTRDYRIVVEAAPLDERHTVLRLRYEYGFGTMARLAMQGYLATAARSKVGFTVVGHDAQGQPEYIGGVRGLVERNTMRYFLAIEAALAADEGPAATQLERRLQAWFDATEHYPRQLHELERPEYLAMKHDETRHDAASK